jgi:hypothetical protein
MAEPLGWERELHRDPHADRWLSWQAEYARNNKLPSIWSVWLLFGVVALLLISLLGGYDRMAEGTNRGKPPTLCQEHAGRPGWQEVCARHR